MKTTLLTMITTLAFHALADGSMDSIASMAETRSQVSLMPEHFAGRTPEEKHQSFEALLQSPQGQRQWARLKQQQRTRHFSGNAGRRFNTLETRRTQVIKSVQEKIRPNYSEILKAADRFQIPADILIASLLTENSLATSNTDAYQEGISSAAKFFDFGGEIHSKYTDYEEQMQRPKARKCGGLHASQLFLCLSPLIGEPSIPGWGRSYGPAQIDLLTAASIADEVGVYDQIIDGQVIPGAFGARPNSWAAIFQNLDHHLHSVRGAVNIIAANMAMASRLYATKGWNIRNNMSVLVTLQRIGKISQRAEGVSSPGHGNYYPAADAFGVYAIALFESGIISMANAAGQGHLSDREVTTWVQSRLP